MTWPHCRRGGGHRAINWHPVREIETEIEIETETEIEIETETETEIEIEIERLRARKLQLRRKSELWRQASINRRQLDAQIEALF